MRYVRLEVSGVERWGTPSSDEVVRLLDRAPYDGGEETGERASSARLLPPVDPTKIVCVGRNYAAHARELGNEVPSEPLLFFKPRSALIGSGEAIVLPRESQRIEHEGEIAIVVGRRLRRASEDEAARAVFAITAANDVTARDLQKKDVQFTRGKGFDTFCPIGPWIETETGPLDGITVETRVDGVIRQRGSSASMIFPIPTLLAYVSSIMTLVPGDVVLTGTPEGVGPLAPGQRVEVEVSGVGVLSSPVAAEG